MIPKLLILLLITTIALAQQSMLICTLTIIDDICTCNFLIFNPNGLNNLTVVGNPTPNCTLEDAQHAIGMGASTNIPSAICNSLPNIEKLSMKNVGITRLNGMPFRNCGKLKTLLLGNNAIEAIPPFVFSTTILERLELNDNKLGSFDEHSFDNLENLRTLNINGNSNGVALPSAVFEQTLGLQNLLVSGCGFTALNPLWFISLTSLVVLDLSQNNFTTIPQDLFSLQQNLRFLDLSRGHLEVVPESTFQNNTNLLILDIQSNKIKEFNFNLFSSLQLLQNLYLSGNLNVTTPSNLFRPLSFLRILEMSSNNITEVHDWFSTLGSLVTVDLSNNNIASIPDNIFTAARAIERINLSKNKITQIDSRSFGSLHMLISLDVHDNLIIEVDHYFISQSSLLRYVDFFGNSCTQIRTDNFGEVRDEYMGNMTRCFDQFDTHPIELTTFNSTIYNWYSIRSNDGWDSLKISIKAFENVHIALSDRSRSAQPPIEIFIGQNRDRGSYILDQGVAVFNDSTRSRLNETAERNFIIGWRFGIVMVFREGDQFPFMAYRMQNEFSVKFFGLRTVIEDSDHVAEWAVTRIQNSLSRSFRNIYDDIEAKIKRKFPIDSKLYVR